MKFLKNAFVLSLFLLSFPLWAQNNCCWSNYNVSVFADYLYWEICNQQEDILQTIDLDDTAEFFNLKANYNSGYRVGATIASKCIDLTIYYTSIDSHQRANVPEVLIPVGGKIRYDIDYTTLDILLGYHLYFHNCLGQFTPFAGIKLAWIDQTLDKFLNSSFNSIIDNDFSGYGPNLGGQLQYQICKVCLPISLIARGSLSLLNGRFKTKGSGVQPAFLSGKIKYDDICAFIAVPNIYLGLNLDLPKIACITSNLQIGYETIYWTSWAHLQGDQRDDVTTIRGQGALGLSGLVIRLQLGY